MNSLMLTNKKLVLVLSLISTLIIASNAQTHLHGHDHGHQRSFTWVPGFMLVLHSKEENQISGEINAKVI